MTYCVNSRRILVHSLRSQSEAFGSYDIILWIMPFNENFSNSLAYAEMRLILARILWKFDLELMNDSKAWNEQSIYTFWDKGPLNIRLKPVVK